MKILVKSFFANEIGILSADIDKFNLDDGNNFYGDEAEVITHVRLLAWCNKFEKWKAFKKDISN